jgi:hypothetical protein
MNRFSGSERTSEKERKRMKRLTMAALEDVNYCNIVVIGVRY